MGLPTEYSRAIGHASAAAGAMTQFDGVFAALDSEASAVSFSALARVGDIKKIVRDNPQIADLLSSNAKEIVDRSFDPLYGAHARPTVEGLDDSSILKVADAIADRSPKAFAGIVSNIAEISVALDKLSSVDPGVAKELGEAGAERIEAARQSAAASIRQMISSEANQDIKGLGDFIDNGIERSSKSKPIQFR